MNRYPTTRSHIRRAILTTAGAALLVAAGVALLAAYFDVLVK